METAEAPKETVTEVSGSYKVENILLTEFNFKRDSEIDFSKEIENKISITTESANFENNDKIVISLKVIVEALQEAKIVFSLDTTMNGIFFKEGEPKLPEDIFKKVNAPAIIYPFIREQMATTCLKAGLGTVFLPPVNFVERNK